MHSFGAQLKRYRLAAGLTQQALAARAGVGRVTVARHESGARQPSVPALKRYALALGVGLEVLVGAASCAAAPPQEASRATK